MNGCVDEYGRALITISLHPSDIAVGREIDVWIDTGFNGDLVLSQIQIDDLGLLPSGTLKAILADGSEAAMQRYSCLVDWFDELREIEVVANDGQIPLLGVGLLSGHELHFSYVSGAVTVE